jgi:hypothetical protein
MKENKMTDKSLAVVLSKCSLVNGDIRELIPGKAVYVNRTTRRTLDNNEQYQLPCSEYIILLDNDGNRVGGIFIMGDVDLHFYIFKKYRNQHYLSNFMKSGWMRILHPNLTTISVDFPKWTTEYKAVKHLADMAGLRLIDYERIFSSCDQDRKDHRDKILNIIDKQLEKEKL